MLVVLELKGSLRREKVPIRVDIHNIPCAIAKNASFSSFIAANHGCAAGARIAAAYEIGFRSAEKKHDSKGS